MRVLITYATRAGSTTEVAATIAESLKERGYSVDVKPIKERPALTEYQAVVIGSAVRMGNWLPEAVEFVKANRETLSRLPVALFTVHMLNIGQDEQSRSNRLAYLNPVRPFITPVDEAYFVGKMDFSRLSFFDRLIAKMVKAVEADHRDWEAIRAWASTVFAGR